MSLQRMRRWSRLVALVLLAAAVPGVLHLAQDDVACLWADASAFGHQETDHGLRAATGQAGDDHCALCHWSRLMRAPGAGGVRSEAPAKTASPLLALALLPHAAPSRDLLPARAPPAFPL